MSSGTSWDHGRMDSFEPDVAGDPYRGCNALLKKKNTDTPSTKGVVCRSWFYLWYSMVIRNIYLIYGYVVVCFLLLLMKQQRLATLC